MPDLLGLTLDRDHAATVSAVGASSEGAAAGFQAGDEILRIDGQPVISIADVQWVLQHAEDGGVLPVHVRRQDDDGAEELELTLELPDGWRRRGSF